MRGLARQWSRGRIIGAIFSLLALGWACAAAADEPADWRACADEGGTCAFSGVANVQYGAANGFIVKAMSGGAACSNASFGMDPKPGVRKRCQYDENTRVGSGWVSCANEGGTCSFVGQTVVRYGSDKGSSTKRVEGPVPCNNATFGDPSPGVVKSCEYDEVNRIGVDKVAGRLAPGYVNNLRQIGVDRLTMAKGGVVSKLPRQVAIIGGEPGIISEQLSGYDKLPPPQPSNEYGKAPPPQPSNEYGKAPPPQPSNEYGKAPPPQPSNEYGKAPPPQYDKLPPPQSGSYDKLPPPQSGGYDKLPPPQSGSYDKLPPPKTGTYEKSTTPVHEAPATSPKLGGVVAGVAGAGVGGAVVGAGGALIGQAAQGKAITYHAPTTWNTNTTVKDLCWRDSYPNTGGVVQNGCPADREWRDSMCYKKCNAGEEASMTMCKSACPAGWRTDPLTCWHDVDIRSADNSKCPWYDKCGLISAQGCSVCPAGYHNDGCTCRIDAQATARTRDVGIGIAGNGCQAGYSKDPTGLLCYPTCKTGYTMVGPVCWNQSCPADFPIQCGASCAVSHDACALSTESQVLTPLQVITNVVGIVVTGGGSAAAEVGAQAASKAAIAASLKAAAARIGKNLTEAAVSSASSTMASASVNGQFDYYSLDPTGVASVVEAYNKPICNVPQP